jgi:hypothetical protein
MTREARITSTLAIRKRNTTTGVTQISYPGMGGSFSADVTGAKGPYPGAMAVSVTGTDVDLSQQTAPGGLCEWGNEDGTNFVEIGLYDPDTNEFEPLFEALPGESFVNRLSRRLGGEYPGTGTASIGTGARIRLRADTAPVVGFFNAFDK